VKDSLAFELSLVGENRYHQTLENIHREVKPLSKVGLPMGGHQEEVTQEEGSQWDLLVAHQQDLLEGDCPQEDLLEEDIM